jgi:hypothetical protein
MKLLTDVINGLHYTIGINSPPPEKVRAAALIWLASIVVVVGVLYVLFRYAF